VPKGTPPTLHLATGAPALDLPGEGACGGCSGHGSRLQRRSPRATLGTRLWPLRSCVRRGVASPGGPAAQGHYTWLVSQLTDKARLRDELLAQLLKQLENLERAQAATQAGATHEEARPENDKDTRALELSYLARGQAARVAELHTAIAEVRLMPVSAFSPQRPAGIGALLQVRDGEVISSLFFAPHSAGEPLRDGIKVLTPRSALGRALLGHCEGDEVEANIAGVERCLELLSLR
jgi:hypothetical protein